MQTVVYSAHEFDSRPLKDAAGSRHKLLFRSEKLNAETAHLAKGSLAVALFASDRANAEVLEQLYEYGIRYVCLRSAGYDHVDLRKAHALGIKVANVPGYSPHSIAEHAAALLLALNRKLIAGQKLMDRCDYRLDSLVGFDLHGKTVGIIGTGSIGSTFGSIMNGFGCHLIGFDPVVNPRMVQIGLKYVSLRELYEQSDIISLHCPLNTETTHLLDTAAFARMKKGVTIINTSRGAVIDTVALITAIEEGIIAMAGLDVYENEKAFFFENMRGQQNTDPLFAKLRSFPNVLMTGHQAFLTREALASIAKITAGNLDAFAEGRPCINEL